MLVIASLVTVFAPVASAEEVTPSIPDLSEYSYITIDEIEPETTVGNLIADTVLSQTEEIDVYNSYAILLYENNYVGNNATIIITENDSITEVYKVKLYGDLDCDGKINSSDLISVRKKLLGITDNENALVSDILADGKTDIKDLIRLKKHQADIAEIPQKRISVFSTRFNWLNSLKVPFTAKTGD